MMPRSYTARSGDFEVKLDVNVYPAGLDLEAATAINEINKDTVALIDGSSVAASSVSVNAVSDSRISATAEALTVDDTLVDLSIFELNLAGTLSANEVLGDVMASIQDSDVTTTVDDVAVSAQQHIADRRYDPGQLESF